MKMINLLGLNNPAILTTGMKMKQQESRQEHYVYNKPCTN